MSSFVAGPPNRNVSIIGANYCVGKLEMQVEDAQRIIQSAGVGQDLEIKVLRQSQEVRLHTLFYSIHSYVPSYHTLIDCPPSSDGPLFSFPL